MKLITLKDNTQNQVFALDSSPEKIRRALDSVAGKDLKSLASEKFRFIIYPPFSKELDLKDNDAIFNVDYSDETTPRISTGNIMGFISLKNDIRVNITSRFDLNDKNYFLHYMLQKICNVAYHHHYKSLRQGRIYFFH